jgi:hypothetical protein
VYVCMCARSSKAVPHALIKMVCTWNFTFQTSLNEKVQSKYFGIKTFCVISVDVLSSFSFQAKRLRVYWSRF